MKFDLNYNIKKHYCNPQKYNKYIIKTINIYKIRKLNSKVD